MARQVRSEATRRKILDAAVEVFNEVGFAAADRGAIIERTGMTKGAFYHHFDSMESLASAIIEDGAPLAAWIEAMTAQTSRAIDEGDIRSELDAKMVSESIIGATFGARMIGQTASDGNDLGRRLTQMWELLFPAIVTETSLGYYREFLAREALRHVEHDAS